jgi:pyridoxal phosphate enzyme (YggS family)
METIRQKIARIQDELAEAALRCGRNPADVRLMGVTKTVDPDRIREAMAAGLKLFGENYVQEAGRKIEQLGRSGIEWHMIGYLQSNKAKFAVRLFDMIHSVSKMSQALELDRRAGAVQSITAILIEVNLSGEASKSGLEPDQVIPFIKSISGFKNLSIQGLMTMPPWFDDPEQARPYFRALRELRDRIVDAGLEGVTMKELSMGMTQDYRVAVEEGSTIVRVGRGIFGERK